MDRCLPSSTAPPPVVSRAAAAWLPLLAVVLVAPVLVPYTSGVTFALARAHAPAALPLATSQLPAFLLSWILYRCVVPDTGPARPVPPAQARRLGTVAVVTWAAFAVGAVVGGYTPRLPNAAAVIGFAGFGLWAEELLFRGTIFGLLETMPGASGAHRARWLRPVPVTAVLFACSHLGWWSALHRFGYANPPTLGEMLQQVAFTLPMGIVLGMLRRATGRLWPGLALHSAINAWGVLVMALR